MNSKPLLDKKVKKEAPKKSSPTYVVVGMGISAFMGSPHLVTGDEVPSDWPEKAIQKLLKRGVIKAGG